MNIQEIADEINGLETGKKEADFAIAKVAKRASGELNPAQKKELHKKLKMKKHKFSRYVYIGGELSELEPIIQHLPEGYSLLDAIARRIRHHINYAVIANDLHDIAEGSHQGIAGRGGEVRPSRSILFNVGITARRPETPRPAKQSLPRSLPQLQSSRICARQAAIQRLTQSDRPVFRGKQMQRPMRVSARTRSRRRTVSPAGDRPYPWY